MKKIIWSIKEYWTLALPLLAAASICLGFFGFLQGATAQEATGISAQGLAYIQYLIETVQLFTANEDPKNINNWREGIAALAAFFTASGAVIMLASAALGKKLWKQFQQLILEFSPATDIFLGCSEPAVTLFQQRSYCSKSIVVIDQNIPVAFESTIKKPAARIVHFLEDPTSLQFLRNFKLHKSNLWISLGNDYLNIDMAHKILEHGESRGIPLPKRLLLNLSNYQNVRTGMSIFDHVHLKHGPVPEVEFFSLYRMAARALIAEYLDLSEPTKHPPHIAIAGGSELAAALVVYAAQHCVVSEDPAQCIRLTLIGKNSDDLARRIRAEHPVLQSATEYPALAKLMPLAKISTVCCDEKNISVDDWCRLQKESPLSAIFIAAETDLETVAATLRMVSLREVTALPQAKVPIVACGQKTAKEYGALTKSAMESFFSDHDSAPDSHAIEGLHCWDISSALLKPNEEYPGFELDKRAKWIRLAYKYASNNQSILSNWQNAEDEAEELWANRERIAFRWSDRLAADHINIKLDLIARYAEDNSPLFKELLMNLRKPDFMRTSGEQPSEITGIIRKFINDNNKEILNVLARIEHRRFLAERLIDGWLPLAPELIGCGASKLAKTPQKKLLKTNHTLVTYDELPAIDKGVDQQKKDIEIANVLLRVLEAENNQAFKSERS